ncbi:MAG: SGNH/GDSL hydrolase family protein [Verrucomicrobiota bacterium JB024]|nr:SGNH/GDSL hydrolase family protein [Verrucomicrobiota bacterium JB024]
MDRETEAPILEDRLFARGLISAGHGDALARFRKKLERKEAITYAAIGGSITQGAAASDDKRTAYGPRFTAWLNQHTACSFINAGVGATTSMFGAFRAQQEMLCQAPDIITVEFAVNDTINPDIEASYEALVRQCVESPAKPLVILIFTMRREGTNLQDKHIPIGKHYGLPMLSYRDALYPEITVGKLAWRPLSPDEVHPNDRGHAFIAGMLEYYIEHAKALEGIQTLPELLHPGAVKYLGGSVIDASRMDLLKNLGWHQYDHGQGYIGYESDKPGASLRVKIKGGTLLIGYVKYAGDFGRVSVKVNGNKFCELDGFYEKPEIQQWAGGHTVLAALADAPAGTEHLVDIELLDMRHPRSHGQRFRIGYFLAAQ